ncbi:MAG: FAD binding domain-containing protein [Candidatus Bipolaricaulia bacterium]
MRVKEFIVPRSIEEAVEIMHSNPKRGAYVAGGTDLLLEDRDLDFVIDLKALDLNYIRQEGDEIRFGATATLSDLERSELAHELADGILYQCAVNFASIQIRNMATIGGNIANAVPSADIPVPFLALGAQVRIRGKEERILSLKRFFTGVRETVLGSDLLEEIIVPVPAPEAQGQYLKIARTPGDIAIINVATLLEAEQGLCKRVRIALGAVAPTPLRAEAAERFLEGKPLTAENIQQASELTAEAVQPITDHRASADYRRKMSETLTRRALTQSIARERGG